MSKATATVWFGVSERSYPWHGDVCDADGVVKDEHLSYLESIGLYVVYYGNGRIDRDHFGLCLKENHIDINDRTGLVPLRQWQHIPSHEWLELLEKAKWIGPKEPRVYLSMWT